MSAMGPAIGAAASRRPRSTPTERPTHLMRCVDDKIVAIRQVADDMSDGDDASRRSNGSATGSHTPRLGSGDARRSLSRAQFASPSPPRGSGQLEVPFRGTLSRGGREQRRITGLSGRVCFVWVRARYVGPRGPPPEVYGDVTGPPQVLVVLKTTRVLYASLTPPVTSGDGSRATVGRVRIRRKEIQPPRPAARRCTRLLHGLRSLKACSVDVPQTYGDGDAYCMRARQYCALRLTVHAQWVPRVLPCKRLQA